MQEIRYKKDVVVCWEGDPADCLYLIRWGSVGIYANYATIRQRELAVLREGDYFGEMGLLDGAPRSATAVVLESGTVLSRIGEREFGEFFAQNPSRVMDLFTRLSHKLRDTTRKYLEVCKMVSEKVGDGTTELDEETDYHFADDARLVAIRDAVDESRAESSSDASA